ncbi:hypothetical protein BS47DRAFT_1390624 [Hydnum rufescens UP504]|uniref:Uncharacterized protein n=1 Tax=Hydnum rufescens UP504 TaxID=1448309 RepID=A0A9P6B2L3_9AGAM|nr:hypothetical protein BS47DRAFT_1390624 [Hydnum rufescens UP504]
MHSSNVVTISSLQPFVDGVEIEIKRVFAVAFRNPSQLTQTKTALLLSASYQSTKQRQGLSAHLEGPYCGRRIFNSFCALCRREVHLAPMVVLAKVLSIECVAISPDPNDAKEYSGAEISSDDSGVLQTLDQSSMATHHSTELSSIQTVSRPNFAENLIFPAVTRHAETTPNPNLHSCKTSRHRVTPSKVSDLTMAHAPNATIVAPSGSDLASFSRSLLHAPNETNISLETALHALAPKELEHDRPSVFHTHSPLVPPRKLAGNTASTTSQTEDAARSQHPRSRINTARRKPQSLLTATAIVRPSLASAQCSVSSSMPSYSVVYDCFNQSHDNHFTMTNISHLSAQADAICQDVKLHNSLLPAPMTEIDYTEMPSADMIIWETFLSQPQASRKDCSKSPKAVVDDGGQPKNPSIFRQSSKLKRHAQMSRPVLLGTPFEVPEGASLEDAIPDQSFIPRQRDTHVPSTGQEISITVPLKFETQSFVSLPDVAKQMPHLHTVGNNETQVGTPKLSRNRHLEMSTPIVIRPSSQRDIDRTECHRLLLSDIPPLVAPLPAIPIMLRQQTRLSAFN